jgi:hypothetical protein
LVGFDAETLASALERKCKSSKDGAAGGLCTQGGALQGYGCTGLRIRGLAQDDEGAAGSVGGLAEAEPCGERNAIGVLASGIAEVEDDGRKSACLKKQVS